MEIITLQQETAFNIYQQEESSLDFLTWYGFWCFEESLQNDIHSHQKDF